MKNKIKAIAIGAGSMGIVGIGQMIDHGIEIVGAIGRTRNLGKDVGTLAGRDAIGIVLTNDLDALLGSVEADIVMIATETEVDKIFPVAMKCIEHGLNIVTISEESFYPWFLETELAAKLDEACKEHGVSMYATGIQDVFGSAIPMALAGSVNKITRFHGYNFQPLEDMGRVVAEGFYLGKTVEEAEAILSEIPDLGNAETRVFMLAIHADCAILGLHPSKTKMKVSALPAPQEIDCPQWDMVIKKGDVCGLKCDCHVETEEGITWDHSIDFAITILPTDLPITEWYIDGDPDMHVRIDNMTGELTTTATAVNRIPDVINAEPGYRTAVDMPKPNFKFLSAEEYLK